MPQQRAQSQMVNMMGQQISPMDQMGPQRQMNGMANIQHSMMSPGGMSTGGQNISQGQGLPPVHQNIPSGHQAIPPGHQTIPPGQQTIPPGHQSLPPGHQTLPPGHQSLPPGHQSLPPGHQAMPPGHQNMPPGHQNMPAGHPNMSNHIGQTPQSMPSDFGQYRQQHSGAMMGHTANSGMVMHTHLGQQRYPMGMNHHQQHAIGNNSIIQQQYPSSVTMKSPLLSQALGHRHPTAYQHGVPHQQQQHYANSNLTSQHMIRPNIAQGPQEMLSGRPEALLNEQVQAVPFNEQIESVLPAINPLDNEFDDNDVRELLEGEDSDVSSFEILFLLSKLCNICNFLLVLTFSILYLVR